MSKRNDLLQKVKEVKLLFMHTEQGLQYQGKTPEEGGQVMSRCLLLFFRNKMVLIHRNLSLFEQGTASTIST